MPESKPEPTVIDTTENAAEKTEEPASEAPAEIVEPKAEETTEVAEWFNSLKFITQFNLKSKVIVGLS